METEKPITTWYILNLQGRESLLKKLNQFIPKKESIKLNFNKYRNIHKIIELKFWQWVRPIEKKIRENSSKGKNEIRFIRIELFNKLVL